MARLSSKTWTNVVLPASDLNTYVRDQITSIDGWTMLLQVQVANTNTEDTSTSSTYADTSLTMSFTPERSDSQIYIIVMQNGMEEGDVSDRLDLRLMRDAVELREICTSIRIGNATQTASITYMHTEASPGTSAVTYHTEFNRAAGSGTIRLQTGGAVYSSLMVVEVVND